MPRCAALFAVIVAGAACGREPDPRAAEARLSDLRRVHEQLHQDLQAMVAADPFVRQALDGDDADLIVTASSALVEDVVREAARRYLDQVMLDLSGVEATAQGKIERKTLFGRMTVGRWRVGIAVKRLEVRLRARTPRLRVVGPTEVDVQLPVEATEAAGSVALRFGWDSSSIANLLCRDFELERELRGRTVRQQHTIGATYRLSAVQSGVSVEPRARDDVIRLKVDLSPESWAVVEDALRTQDSFKRCGLLLDPPDVVRRLKALASEGFNVRLPPVLFRPLRFPGSLHHTAQIDGRPITVAFRARSFEATPRLMWSRAAVGVVGGQRAVEVEAEHPEERSVLALPAH